jgi:hypothetical protein
MSTSSPSSDLRPLLATATPKSSCGSKGFRKSSAATSKNPSGTASRTPRKISSPGERALLCLVLRAWCLVKRVWKVRKVTTGSTKHKAQSTTNAGFAPANSSPSITSASNSNAANASASAGETAPAKPPAQDAHRLDQAGCRANRDARQSRSPHRIGRSFNAMLTGHENIVHS